MNFADKAYDDWKTTNPVEEQAARYEAALEAKAAEIRAEMSPAEWWSTIEEGLCTKPEYQVAMQAIICGNFEFGASEVKKLADAWLDNRAAEMAVDALADGE